MWGILEADCAFLVSFLKSYPQQESQIFPEKLWKSFYLLWIYMGIFLSASLALSSVWRGLDLWVKPGWKDLIAAIVLVRPGFVSELPLKTKLCTFKYAFILINVTYTVMEYLFCHQNHMCSICSWFYAGIHKPLSHFTFEQQLSTGEDPYDNSISKQGRADQPRR